MVPSLVAPPVAATTTRPEPEVTKEPAKTRLEASNRSAGSSITGSDTRATGIDSPVNVDMSTLSSEERTTRASAEIRSPSLSKTMSPGTSSAAGMFNFRPSRRTTARSGNQGRK